MKRRVGTTATYVDLAVRMRLSGYGTADLSSGIKVTDSKFIMSPSAMRVQPIAMTTMFIRFASQRIITARSRAKGKSLKVRFEAASGPPSGLRSV